NLTASNLGLDGQDDVKVPGFTAVNVTVDANQEEGSLVIDLDSGTLDLPWMFRDGFVLQEAGANAAWRRRPGGWDLQVTGLSARSADLRMNGEAEMQFGRDLPLALSLDAAFEGVNLAQKSRYLPVSIMSDNLVSWLDRAV